MGGYLITMIRSAIALFVVLSKVACVGYDTQRRTDNQKEVEKTSSLSKTRIVSIKMKP